MPADRSLIELTAVEAVALLRARKVSPAELVDASAARIAEVEPAVNALPILCLERARAQAARIDPDSRLAGLPISVKDLDEVAGVRHTMGGSVLFADTVSSVSSPMVSILEANGAIPVGKSNSPEFGFNASTINALHGPTRNPYDPRLTVGGSSGGAAASVATGEVWLATGSDLGSSIRLPAAFCGVVGLRPSPGRVPRGRRGMPFSTLPVLGPIARTVGDVALGLDAMVGELWSDPLSLPARPGEFSAAIAAPVGPKRVGWSADLGVTPVDPEIAAICAAAVARFAEAGAAVEEACPDLSQAVEVFHAVRGVNHLAAFEPLVAAEGARVIAEIHESLARARTVPIERFAWAERERAAMFGRLMDFFESHDVLVCPAAIMAPFPAEWRRVDRLGNHQFDSYIDWIAITFAISLLGVPVLSLPVGFTAAGMPVGIQIIGRPRGDAAVLAAGAVLEIFSSGYSERIKALARPGVRNATVMGVAGPLMDASGALRRRMLAVATEGAPAPEVLAADDGRLEAYLRRVVGGVWHPCGTCRMGADGDPMAVVDAAGAVRGVAGLSVCDASVMPTIPCANLNVPVIMIAEKVSDMLKARVG